jgi:hypothetical protein
MAAVGVGVSANVATIVSPVRACIRACAPAAPVLARRPISTCLLGLLPLAVGLLIPITLLCFPKPRADLHLVATCELELRLGVRLGFQVALVHTFRQRTHGCIHAQALRRLDVLSGAALASRAQASPVLHPRV